MSLGHLSKRVVHHIAADIAAVQPIDAVPRILEIVCRSAIKLRAGGAATGAVIFIGGATGTPGRSWEAGVLSAGRQYGSGRADARARARGRA
jgi:hypothetical protein